MRRDSETLGQKTASRPEGKNRAQKSTVDTQGYREEKGMMEWWKIGVMEYWSVGEEEYRRQKTGDRMEDGENRENKLPVNRYP